MNEKITKRIEDIIHNWEEKTFHNNEALPAMIVTSLAEEISNKAYDIYSLVKEEYDLEDIDFVAENEGEELTEEEKKEILNRYQNLDTQTLDDISEVMHWVIRQREEKK